MIAENVGSGGVRRRRLREEEGARNATSAVDGSRAFGYVPLARVRRWTFLVTKGRHTLTQQFVM